MIDFLAEFRVVLIDRQVHAASNARRYGVEESHQVVHALNAAEPQRESLFRAQVADTRQQDWMGSVHLRSLRSGWWLALLPGGTVVLLVMLLVFGEYTRSEHVRGQLVPSKGLIAVAASASGAISSVAVTEGQLVQAGQTLAEISIERDSGAVGRTADLVAAELQSQRLRQQSELEQLDALLARKQQSLEQRRNSLQTQLSLLQTTLTIRQQQSAGARRLLERIEPIRASGQLTALQIHQYETAALEAQAQVELAQLQSLNVSREIDDLDTQLNELPATASSQRNALLSALADTSQAIARNAAEQSLLIRAPRAGRVSGLTVINGASVEQGQQLLAIIPDGSELQAELWIPASAIGRIKLNSRVAMRYDAFPYQQYGQQYGHIVDIALRALSPEEIQQASGMRVNESAYRALVVPDLQQIVAAEGSYPLRTSMSLEAAVMLDRRRLIELFNLPLRGDQSEQKRSALAVVVESSP